MKPGIHPKLNAIIFVDASTGHEVITRSTMTSKERRVVDGVEHYVVRLDISSFSHPFYTGKLRVVDTERRVERFKRRYVSHLASGTHHNDL